MLLQSNVSCGPRHSRRYAAAGPHPCRLAVSARLTPVSAASIDEVGTVSTSRRSLLLSGIAALGLPLLPVGKARAAQASLQDGIEEYINLEAAGKLNTAKALESIRSKYGFKRGPDGRVYVKGAKGTFFAVRLDMEVPGAMLFRDTSNSQVYALQTEALQQIDLSSDQVVILLLGDGEWERMMSPITLEDEDGKTRTLTLSETEFRNVVGLISSSTQEEGDDK